jgi:hypothetical protein
VNRGSRRASRIRQAEMAGAATRFSVHFSVIYFSDLNDVSRDDHGIREMRRNEVDHDVNAGEGPIGGSEAPPP